MKKGLTVLVMCFMALNIQAGIRLSSILSLSPVYDSSQLELKAVGTISYIEIDRNWNAGFMPGIGTGITLQYVDKRNGKNFAWVSGSFMGIFNREYINDKDYRIKFSLALGINTLNNIVGAGVKFNGKNFTGLVNTNVTIF